MLPLGNARKISTLIGVFVFSVALGLVSTLSGSFGLMLLALALGISLLALVVGVWSISGLASVLVFGGAITVSMLALRAGAEVTVADALLGIAFGTVLIMAVRRPVDRTGYRWHLPVLVLVVLVVFGGLGGSFSAGDLNLSLVELARFAASSMVVVALFWLWAPGRLMLTRLCWATVLGATVNAILGLVLPKFGDRAVGLADHPNHLAMACSLAVGPTLGLMLIYSGHARRFLLAACLAMLGLAIVTSGSRAGLLAAGAAVACFLLVTRRWKLIGVGLVSVLVVAAGLYFKVFSIGELNAVNRLRGDRSSVESDRERLALAEETIASIAEHPITGSGFEAAKAAHSIYLQLWVSAGLLGLIFALGLGVVTLRILLDARRSSDLLTLGMACSYLGYLLAGAVSNILWDRYIWLHLAILVSLAATSRGVGETSASKRDSDAADQHGFGKTSPQYGKSYPVGGPLPKFPS